MGGGKGLNGPHFHPQVSSTITNQVHTHTLIMRVLLVTNLLIIFVGIGYCYRIDQSVEPFFEGPHQNPQERQGEVGVGSQIVPLVGLAGLAGTGALAVNYLLQAQSKILS